MEGDGEEAVAIGAESYFIGAGGALYPYIAATRRHPASRPQVHALTNSYSLSHYAQQAPPGAMCGQKVVF